MCYKVIMTVLMTPRNQKKTNLSVIKEHSKGSHIPLKKSQIKIAVRRSLFKIIQNK